MFFSSLCSFRTEHFRTRSTVDEPKQYLSYEFDYFGFMNRYVSDERWKREVRQTDVDVTEGEIYECG